MILEKLEPISTAAIQEKGIESVVDWFERYKEYFYTLGWCYFQNQQQIEELFYRSILKVHKELPRYKGNPSYKMWVTSMFIENVRELSRDTSLQVSEETEPRQDVFQAMNQLVNEEKEALILTYVMGFSLEEAAEILGLLVVKMKDLLFSGIQSVRKQLYGSDYHGCKEYQKHYIDYLEKSMERPAKIEFEIHLYNCPECQADLGSFQEVGMTSLNFAEGVNELNVPPQLMENVRNRLADKKEHRQQKKKKYKKWALVFASAFAFVMAIGFITGAFPKVYYAWTEDDVHLRAFLQEGFGQRLSLEAENDGVKVKIKGVVADDVQTLVFYEIHNMKEDKKYFMSLEDGLSVVNEFDIMRRETYPRFSIPDVEAEMNKKEKNVFYGKVALRPLEEDQGVIKLRITKLQELTDDPSLSFGFTSGDYKTGEWSFEFPATKQPSAEYAINEQKELEGVPIRFDKMIVAPTATVLHFGINTEKPEKRIDFLNFKSLEVNNKKVKAEQYGSHFMDYQLDSAWTAFQAYFDPLYGKKPKEVRAQVESIYLSIIDHKSIELSGNQKFPQTIEYADSTISIDKVKAGQATEIIIKNDDLKNREYESLQIDFVDENDQQPNITHMDSKSVLVDKDGVEYDSRKGPVDYEKLEQPRYFVTEQTMRVEGIDETSMKLRITGYNTMKYLDEVWDLGTVLVSGE
jgi:DNA-directed RNA polymerase specialized sigma24 family protein